MDDRMMFNTTEQQATMGQRIYGISFTELRLGASLKNFKKTLDKPLMLCHCGGTMKKPKLAMKKLARKKTGMGLLTM